MSKQITITLTVHEARALRDFAAYAVRAEFGVIARRRLVARVCEEKLLRALVQGGSNAAPTR